MKPEKGSGKVIDLQARREAEAKDRQLYSKAYSRWATSRDGYRRRPSRAGQDRALASQRIRRSFALRPRNCVPHLCQHRA